MFRYFSQYKHRKKVHKTKCLDTRVIFPPFTSMLNRIFQHRDFSFFQRTDTILTAINSRLFNRKEDVSINLESYYIKLCICDLEHSFENVALHQHTNTALQLPRSPLPREYIEAPVQFLQTI